MKSCARENHHKKKTKPEIHFFGQPLAQSCQDLFDSIKGGSVYRYLVVDPGNVRWNWNLLAVRLDGVDGWADVWGCHLGRDHTNPSISLFVTRNQIAEIVRHLFSFAVGCRNKLPIGYRHSITPKAVNALLAADALAGAVRR